MRLRHKKNAEIDIYSHQIVLKPKTENEKYFDLSHIFANSNPIHIELGMGKGKFITEMAILNPKINYIGIEKSATIVLKAVDNLTHKKDIHINQPIFSNLKFICEDVINLNSIFQEHSIDKIFLNFSDPWPKKRHESRRLTHNKFLLLYEKILKPNSFLEFKTDNINLFNFSIEEIKKSNFQLLEYTYDLHHDIKLNLDNVMTEYEYKFSAKGNKICKLIAKI